MQTVIPPARQRLPRSRAWVSEIWETTSSTSRWTRWAVRSSSSPGGAQGCPARAAVEEAASELLLEELHLAADRGLGDAKPLRGPAERALLGHGAEHLELAEVH